MQETMFTQKHEETGEGALGDRLFPLDVARERWATGGFFWTCFSLGPPLRSSFACLPSPGARPRYRLPGTPLRSPPPTARILPLWSPWLAPLVAPPCGWLLHHTEAAHGCPRATPWPPSAVYGWMLRSLMCFIPSHTAPVSRMAASSTSLLCCNLAHGIPKNGNLMICYDSLFC